MKSAPITCQTIPPERKLPHVVFDGKCGFCRFWVEQWEARAGDILTFSPFQDCASDFPDVGEERFRRAVHLIDTDRRAYFGAEAVFRILRYAEAPGYLTLYRWFPPFAWVAEAFYPLIERHRPQADKIRKWIWGREATPPSYALVSWVFLRLLALIHLVAFGSLWSQVHGLVGEEGILPARDYFSQLPAYVGPERYVLVPSLCWLNAGDAMLTGLCAAGMVAGMALLVGAVPIAALLVLYVCYLSLTTAGQLFLGYQWDALLLETTFLALFLAPKTLWSRPWRDRPPPFLVVVLFWWLNFRLMFSAGAVKVLSGDPAWRDLTALEYHFWSQPLPSWTSWYAAQLPDWSLKLGVLGNHVFELLFPFFMLFPRRIRFLAFGANLLLQGGIALTGNFGFFNLLAMVLSLMLLDDLTVPRKWRVRWLPEGIYRWRRPRREHWFLASVATVLLFLGALQLAMTLVPNRDPQDEVRLPASLLRWSDPFRAVNRYGLFAVMTKERREIVIEGSNDGAAWQPYEFRWKPGDPQRRPRFATPHMPRLDWQMWFAALGDNRQHPWVFELLKRIGQGSEPVLGLLAENPFPDGPPRYLRARQFDYRFASPEQGTATGAWWVRTEREPWFPGMVEVRPPGT